LTIGAGRIYGTDPNVHWAAVHMFVAFLMDESVDPKNKERLLDYMRAALGEGKGDSSNTFDRAFGKEIEVFEKPFAEWLEKR
jgi:hypothetical protein